MHAYNVYPYIHLYTATSRVWRCSSERVAARPTALTTAPSSVRSLLSPSFRLSSSPLALFFLQFAVSFGQLLGLYHIIHLPQLSLYAFATFALSLYPPSFSLLALFAVAILFYNTNTIQTYDTNAINKQPSAAIAAVESAPFSRFSLSSSDRAEAANARSNAAITRYSTRKHGNVRCMGGMVCMCVYVFRSCLCICKFVVCVAYMCASANVSVCVRVCAPIHDDAVRCNKETTSYRQSNL